LLLLVTYTQLSLSQGKGRRQDDNPTRIRLQFQLDHKAAFFLLHFHHQQRLQSPLYTLYYHSETPLSTEYPLRTYLSTVQLKTDEFMTTIENLKTIGWSSLAQPLATQTSFAGSEAKIAQITNTVQTTSATRYPLNFALERHLTITSLTSSTDPFAEADEDTGQVQQSQSYIHIRIQRTFNNPLLLTVC
jgi:hypothetical protein